MCVQADLAMRAGLIDDEGGGKKPLSFPVSLSLSLLDTQHLCWLGLLERWRGGTEWR